MSISAATVKHLRLQTGAGMMECKKALVETNGDIEQAVDLLRKKGISNADKKASRVAAEGLIAIALADSQKEAAIVEINCETDFVAKGDDFIEFANSIADLVLQQGVTTVEELSAMKIQGVSVDEKRRQLIAKLGENINIRRASKVSSEYPVGIYQHSVRMGALVSISQDNVELAKDIAMHIVATKPAAIAESGLSADLLERERKIHQTQAQESGKPAEIVEKMVVGKMRKFVAENTLLGQAYIKDLDMTVAKLLASKGAQVATFVRFEVGEGIEKKQENFADEVEAQAAAMRKQS